MKKFALGLTIVAIIAIGFFFIPGVSADEGTPPDYPGFPMGGLFGSHHMRGFLQEDSLEKIADNVGYSLDELTSLMENGDRLHEILLDLGYTDEEIFEMMREIRQGSPMHEYTSTAIADALGITIDELEGYRTEGLNMDEISAALGITIEELTEGFYRFIEEVRNRRAIYRGACNRLLR